MRRSLSALAAAVLVSLLPARLGAQPLTMGPLELGDAWGEPGEVVDVPVRATFDHPVISFMANFQFDPDRLDFLLYHVRGTVAERTRQIGVAFREFDGGEANFGLGDTGNTSDEFHLPPGERQLIGFLRFRVRALARPGATEVAPVETISATAGGTGFSIEVDGREISGVPSAYMAGSVAIRAPSGPRPVDDLACEQFLDRVRLSFRPSESYDAIEVSRNGVHVALLPGDASNVMDPFPGIGAFTYAVTASRGGAASVPVSCDVSVATPMAPPPEKLECGESGLAWTNPLTYDRLLVFRDGEQVAVLPGDARSFSDPERPEVLTIYSLAGQLEGFLSPRVNCIDHAVWIMEAGDVQVPLDAERVEVPIFATNALVARSFDAYLDMDMSRLDLTPERAAALAGTAGYPDPEFFAMGLSAANSGAPACGIIYDYHNPVEEEKDLQPGLRQLLVKFIFRPAGSFAEGDVVPIRFLAGGFCIRAGPPRGDWYQAAGIFISGQIRFGSAGPAGVQALEARVDAGAGGGAQAGGAGAANVVLAWRNAAVYDAIRIERDGSTVAEIAGTAVEHRDLQVAPGIHTYKVIGVAGGRSTFPANVFLSTVAPAGAFLRGDASGDRRIDLTDPVVTLNYLFLRAPPPACEDGADADDDGRLTLLDSILVLNYLHLAGGPLRAPGTTHAWLDPTPDGLGCGR